MAILTENAGPSYFRPRSSAAARERSLAGTVLALPAALLLAALLLGPSGLVLVLSFSDASLGLSSVHFVGLSNYLRMLDDPGFAISIRNTALYVVIVVPLSILLGLGAALQIERRTALKGFYRTAYFLPVAATLVALATAWEVILHPTFGFANAVLSRVGVEPARFLSSPDSALYALAVIGVWQLIGFNMILFLAGLSTIPRELYEAAAIDGADRGLNRFLLVTWPMLAPVTLFVTVMTVIRAFSVFETVAVLTQGGPMKSTTVVLYTLYEEGFRYFRVGYASAIAVSFFAFVLLLSLVQTRASDRNRWSTR
ncbi:multiple sugar transport system permease protein [Mesorhizobium robiniae]|uniref:Multiple sugar transport system permease protein n=1 Tax=Mesorhizobium robiniae TaxID=559315 RepID=A0ABV2GT54_9HYPH